MFTFSFNLMRAFTVCLLLRLQSNHFLLKMHFDSCMPKMILVHGQNLTFDQNFGFSFLWV